MEASIDWSTIIVACIALIGTLSGNYVAYSKQKKDRIAGMEESRAMAAAEKQAIKDEFKTINEKLDAHNDKLDKHNGFEGRIIALEVIAEWLQEEKKK